MARNSSPNPTEESNSVFYETEDRNNIQALIRPRSPESTDDDQPPPKPTCLSQLDGWNDHGDDPEKAINIHLSHTTAEISLSSKIEEDRTDSIKRHPVKCSKYFLHTK